MKVLSDRTAADLVRLLRERPALPPRRVRIAHGASSARPRPFACRLARDTADGAEDGAQALFCYLPPETAGAVRFRGAVVPTDQTLGTAEEPWVRLGVAGELRELHLVLAFETQESEEEGGEPVVVASGWSLSADGSASAGRWPHLVWALEDGLGAVQYHLGSLSIGDPAAGEELPPEDPDKDPCEAADKEKFPSDIDDISGPSGSGDHDGGSGAINEGDKDQFPSKTDVCW